MSSGKWTSLWSRIALAMALWAAIIAVPKRPFAPGYTFPNSLRGPSAPCPIGRVRAISSVDTKCAARPVLGLARGGSRKDRAADRPSCFSFIAFAPTLMAVIEELVKRLEIANAEAKGLEGGTHSIGAEAGRLAIMAITDLIRGAT